MTDYKTYIVKHDTLSKEEREVLHLKAIVSKTEVKARSEEEAINKVIQFHREIEKSTPKSQRVFPLTNKENIISCEVKDPTKKYGLVYKVPDSLKNDEPQNDKGFSIPIIAISKADILSAMEDYDVINLDELSPHNLLNSIINDFESNCQWMEIKKHQFIVLNQFKQTAALYDATEGYNQINKDLNILKNKEIPTEEEEIEL